MQSHPEILLRRLLQADGVLCLGFGLILAAFAEAFGSLLALPPGLLRWSGMLLLPWGAWVLWLGLRHAIAIWPARIVIAGNLVWTADSLLLLASGWIAPNAFGVAFVLAQAALVAVIAVLQALLLARSAAPQPARA